MMNLVEHLGHHRLIDPVQRKVENEGTKSAARRCQAVNILNVILHGFSQQPGGRVDNL